MGTTFSSIFDEENEIGEWRVIPTQGAKNIHISVKEQGCSKINTDSNIPVVKIELLFDPDFKLSDVIKAVQNEK